MIQVRSVSALSDGEVGVICAEGINRLIGLLGGVETNISYQQLTNVLYFNSSIGELLTSSAAVDLTFEQVQSYIVYCTAVGYGLVVGSPEPFVDSVTSKTLGSSVLVTSVLTADVPVVGDGVVGGFGLLLGGNLDCHSEGNLPGVPSFNYLPARKQVMSVCLCLRCQRKSSRRRRIPLCLYRGRLYIGTFKALLQLFYAELR